MVRSVVVHRSEPFRSWFLVVWEGWGVSLEIASLYVGNGVENMAVDHSVGEEICLRKKKLFARTFEGAGIVHCSRGCGVS